MIEIGEYRMHCSLKMIESVIYQLSLVIEF